MEQSAMTQMYESLADEFVYARETALKLKELERKQIVDAILYALDEDGHTGAWKLKFANKYYEEKFGK